ncbi:MAG: spermidine/putrescine ABC transporter permease PotB [Thermodesulfobacteriota bacterium]
METRPKNRFRTFVIGAFSAWLLIFVLAPNLMIAAVSLATRSEERFAGLPLSLESYVRLFDPIYLSVFLRSLGMALLITALCLVAGYPFAYIIARSPARLRNALLLLTIVPFWTNSLIRTYAVALILRTRGLLNYLLVDFLGVLDKPLDLLYTGTAVVAGSVYVLLPFMVLPLYAVIERLDPAYTEAGRDLGAGRLDVFFRIVVPLTMPGILAGCLLVFLPALGLFYIPDVLGGAKDLFIGNFIKNQFLDARDWPFGAAGSVVLTALMAVLLLTYYLVMKRLGEKVL